MVTGLEFFSAVDAADYWKKKKLNSNTQLQHHDLCCNDVVIML